MLSTLFKIVGGVLAVSGATWLHGHQEMKDYREGKHEKLDELAMEHYATSFHNLESPERAVILALYEED